MSTLRVQVRMPWDSGLPEDVSVNTWHFDGTLGASLDAIFGALTAFYGSVDAVLSPLINSSPDVCTMTAYDLADPEPRAPIDSVTFTVTPTTASVPLPPELAICMSFRATPSSGVSRARQRGRVFLGPIGNLWAADEGTIEADGTISDGACDLIRDAGDTLLAASLGSATWEWGVQSTVDDQLYTISNGWVDNEWDIQRSRGRRASQRFTFS